MENIGKDALKKLHAPIAYTTADPPNDIAYPNAADDFECIQNVPAYGPGATDYNTSAPAASPTAAN